MEITAAELCSSQRLWSYSTYFKCYRHLQYEYSRYERSNCFFIQVLSELLCLGYYGSGGTYPYQAYGVGDGTWSNGTDQGMTFLSGYPHDSYSMDGAFEVAKKRERTVL